MKTLILVAALLLVAGCESPRECRVIEATITESGPDGKWGCASGVRTFYRSEFGGGKTCLLLGEPGERVKVRECLRPEFWQRAESP